MLDILEKAVMTPLMLTGRISDLIRSGTTNSLVGYTKATRSEPITLVDIRLMANPALADILQAATSLYCGYYLQAVSIAVNVGKVNVIRLLEKVNPARDPIEAGGLFLEGAFSSESYQYLLPGPSIDQSMVSLEGYRHEESGSVPDGAALGRGSLDLVSASSNLSVGKLFNVDINSDGNNAQITVSVRLIVSPVETDVLSRIIAHAEKDISIKERYYGLKSGRLALIKDGIFCVDLIREHRETLMKDSSGQYAEMIKRSNKNRLSGLVSLNPSVATASNIAVFDANTARQIEGEIKGKLNNFKIRQRIFDKTYLMMMYVVDTDYDMVTIYFRDIALPTTLSLRDIKQVNKNGGMDVAEVLRTLQLGQSPRF